jgi:hypothetical protein
MGRWTKKALPNEELMRLGLTPEEGFVLSRLDVALSPPEVVALTGLPLPRVEEILGNLGTKGAVASDRPDDPLLISDEAPARAEAPRAELEEVKDDEPPVLEPLEEEPPVLEPLDEDLPFLEPLEEGLPVDDGVPLLEAESEEAEERKAAQHRASGVQSEEPDEPEEADEPEDVSYRKIYETEIRKMERDDRIRLAHHATGPHLCALCYDVDPGVIDAILDNPHSGLAHARLAARHHGTSAGLEHIAKRAPLLGDSQVQRALIRNPQLSETLCRKILSPKRMNDAYKASVDTDIPERTRAFARGTLRTKFSTSQGEERAGLIMVTEGRVLTVLTGLTLDGRATSILCSRQYTSQLFVQNLARWGACPPVLLAHLLKQQIVKRQLHLRNMILRHPNCPGDAKRKM